MIKTKTQSAQTTSFGYDYKKIPKIVDRQWFQSHGPFPKWVLDDLFMLNHKKRKDGEFGDILEMDTPNDSHLRSDYYLNI